MEYLTIGETDLKVSPICIGTWQFNNGETTPDKTWPAQSAETSKAIVDKAIDLGVNFFDTAEGYRNSEETLGRILEGRRKNVVIASKFGVRCNDYTPEEVEKSITTTCQRLKTDYIDLYQVHYAPYIQKNMQACVQELNRQKAKGVIREWAVCNFGPKNLADVIEAGGKPVSNQVSYNLLWRAIEYEILPACQKYGISILPYSPLQQGLLTGKFRKLEDVPEGRRRTKLFNAASTELSKHGTEGCEKQLFQTIATIQSICDNAGVSMPVASLSWLLQQELVKSVIVGASSPDQVEKNCQIVKLKQDIVMKLSEATEEVKAFIGNAPDPWAPVSRIE